ncbi:hypothetical protein [Rathayibacter sp. Leaf248]|uniref:hypothetical protein n=1 Tax=Rathayibacter sp. Leaf248 TaxID=2876555 RepID=UPI001E38CE19|nr:hypothetical protein [Rathayibacter sp. Leaf248]
MRNTLRRWVCLFAAHHHEVLASVYQQTADQGDGVFQNERVLDAQLDARRHRRLALIWRERASRGTR